MTKRGFGYLPCPICGVEETSPSIGLDEWGDGVGETITCPECEGTYAVARIENLIAKWGPVLAWLAKAPILE